ncbi:reverse transcriptase domain-containing protein [Tanacetum coccineum]|uniref:Reverse transcriptase domain-containing protein n=1 Tax=Tanacetum coccineum TaxID=301880 RepID=A0ABQ5F4J9_9ASTR
MSTRSGPSPTTNTSAVRNTMGRGKEKSQENPNEPASDAALREFYDKNYNQLLPILAEKMHQEKVQQEKLKAVKARLNFEEASQYSESRAPSRRGDLDQKMPVACPEALNQGTTDLDHLEGKIRKERLCSEGWKRVYFTGWVIKKRVCPHTLVVQGVSHITAAAKTLKAIIRILAREERSPPLRGIMTEKHAHVREERCQKARTVQENIGNLNLKRKCKVWRIRTYPDHSHVKTYDGSEDPEDHLKIFQAAAKVERWAMPTWCHMFNSTLTGNARVWFDDLPLESIDSYDDLKETFLENYLQQKKCIKDPVEIYHIKQREGESTEDFVRRFKTESRDVKGVPEVMRISGFMHGITNPELIKRLHDKIPKSVDEMWKITTAFLRVEVAADNQERKKTFPPWKQQDAGHRENFKKGGFKNQQRPEKRQDRFALLTKTPKEILALDKGKFKPPPPMTTPVEKRNASKFCEFHGEVGHTTDECMHLKRQIEEMLKTGKLSHLIKELKQSNGKDQAKVAKKGEAAGKDKPLAILMVQTGRKIAKQRITQTFSPETMISFPPLGEEDGTEGPMVIEAEVGGHLVHRMYVDRGASSEIMYEHCFNQLRPKIRKQMVLAATYLVMFSGEIIWPLGKVSLLVKIGDEEHSTSAWMNFMVVRSHSPYNGIIGRPVVRRIKAIPSTAHRMLKFSVTGGAVTLRSSRIIPLECAIISGPRTHQPVVDQDAEEKIQVAIHPEYPEQTIAIGSTLTKEGRKKLCELLMQNLDIFAWKPADMTGVSRHIAEHKLNVREVCFLVRQKKRGQASERNKGICEEMEKLVNADFKDLNKACPKDGYPLPEIDWKVESLCGYPFKCFLDAYKGYHQIKMAKEDEEKTVFITSQGILCYSKMPFGLKNVGATYQRLVYKAFQKQIGRNLEAYVDDLVIKSCTEQEIIWDVGETFRTLRKINMKLNPKKCTFGMKEGVFLGYKVNSEGLTVCPDKVEVILNLPSPKCLKDVQRLNGKLASLNRFLSKSAERSLPFFKTLKKCTKKSDFQWTTKAEAAFQQMKESIAELPMMAAP